MIVSTSSRNRVLFHWLIPLANVLINFRMDYSDLAWMYYVFGMLPLQLGCVFIGP
jgi:hypothetical protein